MSVSIRFTPIRSVRLRDEVLGPIRKAILFGELAVGERLIEEEIAAQMGVSRVPVREALRQLEHEGLIVSYPHRGAIVAAVDEDEVEELYQLRAELEAFAIAAATRTDPMGLRERLRPLVEAMESDAARRDLTKLAELDLEFHHAIIDNSGYRILARVWQTMDGPVRARLHRILNESGEHESGEPAASPDPGAAGAPDDSSGATSVPSDLIWYTAISHRPILDAVVSGDPALAAAAVRHHVLETKDLTRRR